MKKTVLFLSVAGVLLSSSAAFATELDWGNLTLRA